MVAGGSLRSDPDFVMRFSAELTAGSLCAATIATGSAQPAPVAHNDSPTTGVAADVQSSLQSQRQVQANAHQAGVHMESIHLALPNAAPATGAATVQRMQGERVALAGAQGSAAVVEAKHRSSVAAHEHDMSGATATVQAARLLPLSPQLTPPSQQSAALAQVPQQCEFPLVTEHITPFLLRPYELLHTCACGNAHRNTLVRFGLDGPVRADDQAGSGNATATRKAHAVNLTPGVAHVFAPIHAAVGITGAEQGVQHSEAASKLLAQPHMPAGMSSQWQSVLDILINAGPQQVPEKRMLDAKSSGQGSNASEMVGEQHCSEAAKDAPVSKSKRKRNKKKSAKH